MDGCGGLILALLGLGVVILPFVAVAMSWSQQSRLTELEGRLAKLEKKGAPKFTLRSAAGAREDVPPPPPAKAEAPSAPVLPPAPPAPALPPPPPEPGAGVLKAAPPAVKPSPRSLPPTPSRDVRFEDFLGIKLFAWIGAVLAFLGVAFFVKYSFDNNLIRPPVRVAIGILAGLASIGIGLRLDRIRYRFLVQALCSSGILIFYGTLYSAFQLFNLVPQPIAFGLMVLATLAAFVLAVRLDALAIGVLGLAGGFLTPPLLSTGADHPLALFSYTALLDTALLALVARKRWLVLVPLSVLGTAFLQLGWVISFLHPETLSTALTVFAVFPALYAAGFLFLRRSGEEDAGMLAAFLAPGFISLAFGLAVVGGALGEVLPSPVALGIFLLAVDLALLLPAAIRRTLRPAVPAAGIAVFLVLAVWTARFLDPSSLSTLLVLLLVFAALHGIGPTILERLRPGGAPGGVWGHVFSPLALLFILGPICKFPAPSPTIWAVVLLLSSFAFLGAWVTGQVLGFASAVVLTTVLLGSTLLQVPEQAGLPGSTLALLCGFAVLFTVAASKLAGTGPASRTGDARILPALSALLPFALLILAVLKLAVPNPSAIFAAAALMTVLALAAARASRSDALVGVSLFALAVLEFAWHALHFAPEAAGVPALWYGAFFLGFFLTPLAGRKERSMSWVPAAAAGPMQFLLLFWTTRAAWPAFPRGLLAIVFGAVYVAGLAYWSLRLPAAASVRKPVLALLGGTALLFVTAAIPIQFERQWITVGWALEGVALFWLFRRVPEEGLRIGGFLLLGASFVRLLPGVNPYLLSYCERGPVPLLNWFLYTYGLVAACHYAGARLLDRERPRVLDLDARKILAALGTILAFILVNLEIADFFSEEERYVAFRFSASLAQDMTYSIAWALFALVLLLLGVRVKGAALRYSGLGLLAATVFKVAFHDLWELGGLYRVGSLVGLAIILLVVSFLYHQFRGAGGVADRTDPSPRSS